MSNCYKSILFVMEKSHLSLKMIIVVLILAIPLTALSQTLKENPELDNKVQAFLQKNNHNWYDMNVPEVDGQLLFDIIIKNGYKNALEIGTSTGLSGIWIAWALSKTGGKLITVEIDERRYAIAVKNFKEAGLSDYIDARLEDAHKLVKEIEGPFDFVFSDADKYWYKNYFIDVDPKLAKGGCYTAHNISDRLSGRRSGQGDFLKYIRSLDNYSTLVDSRGGGLSISYKK